MSHLGTPKTFQESSLHTLTLSCLRSFSSRGEQRERCLPWYMHEFLSVHTSCRGQREQSLWETFGSHYLLLSLHSSWKESFEIVPHDSSCHSQRDLEEPASMEKNEWIISPSAQITEINHAHTVKGEMEAQAVVVSLRVWSSHCEPIGMHWLLHSENRVASAILTQTAWHFMCWIWCTAGGYRTLTLTAPWPIKSLQSSLEFLAILPRAPAAFALTLSSPCSVEALEPLLPLSPPLPSSLPVSLRRAARWGMAGARAW